MNVPGIAERTVATNGVELRVLEAGEPDRPLIVLCHGFPELAWSWRHQIPVLADAGYHVVAPDQRGYGGSSRPEAIEDYDIEHLTGDILGLVEALGQDRTAVIGHDWGANVAWGFAQRYPAATTAVAGLSVPFIRRSSGPPTEIMQAIFGESFFYMLYFQEPGVADADLDRDPERTLRGLFGGLTTRPDTGGLGDYFGPDDGRGFVSRLPRPDALPEWLSQAELDHYVAEFTRTGFTGGLNWYRNLDRNWALSEALADTKVTVPALFLAGTDDPVLAMSPPDRMEGWVTDLRATILVDGAGHWVQQEEPHQVNEALLGFLDAVRRA